jgi:hypothetical protein
VWFHSPCDQQYEYGPVKGVRVLSAPRGLAGLAVVTARARGEAVASTGGVVAWLAWRLEVLSAWCVGRTVTAWSSDSRVITAAKTA